MCSSLSLSLLLIAESGEEREFFLSLLEQSSLANYQLESVETIEQALQWCQNDNPDAILVDLASTDAQWECLQHLRSYSGGLIPAMILVARQGNVHAAVQALKEGAQDYLVKDELTADSLHQSLHSAVAQVRCAYQLKHSHHYQKLTAAIALHTQQLHPLDEILTTTTAELQQLLKADRVLVYQFHPDQCGTVIAESVLSPWVTMLHHAVEPTVFQPRNTPEESPTPWQAIEDIYPADLSKADLAKVDLAVWEQFDIKASLTWPIFVAGDLWGLLVAHQCSAPHRWRPEWLDGVDQVVVQLAIAIQQAHHQEQLRAEHIKHQQTEIALHHSAAKFQQFLEAASEAVIVTNASGQIVVFNSKAEDLFGYDASEILGQSIECLMPDRYRHVHIHHRATYQAHPTKRAMGQSRPLYGLRKDGTEFPIEVGLSTVTIEAETFTLSFLVDITERSKLEAEREQAKLALQQSEATLQLFVRYAPAGIAMFDRNLYYLAASQRWVEDYGLASPESIVGQCHYDIFPEIPDHWRQIHQRCLAGAIEHCDEDLFERADGSQQWLRWEVRPWYIHDQEIGGILILTEDITERKQVAADLMHLAAIVESSSDAIISTTLDGLIMSWNAGAEKLLGYTAEEIVGQSMLRLMPFAHRQGELETLNRLRQGESTENYETVRQCKNGTLLDVSVTISPIKDATGKLIGASKIVHDISIYKRAERVRLQAEKVRFELELLETILDTILAGYWDEDIPNQQLYISPGFKRMFGYENSELANSSDTWKNLILPDDFPEAQASFERHVQSRGRVPYYYEARYRHKKGYIVWVMCSGRVIDWDEQAKPRRVIGCYVDITERKRAEDLSSRLAAIVNASGDAIISEDLNGTILSWNPSAERMFGYTAQEVIGQSVAVFVPPDRVDDLIYVLRSIRDGKSVENFETERLRKDGQRLYVSSTVSPIKDKAGNVIAMASVDRDISDRKRIESQLRSLSDRLGLALKAGAIGTLEWDFNQYAYWDDRMYDLYGIPRSETPPSFQEWLSLIHPEDQAESLAIHQAALRTSDDINMEFRIVRPDGTIRFLKAHLLIQRNPEGEPFRMVGINYDITERKQAELELIRSRDLREVVFNESTDALFLVDPLTLLTLDCNRRAVELFEATDSAELIGIDGQTLQRQPFTADELATIVADMRVQGFWSREIEYVTRRGRLFWGNIATKPMTIAGTTMNLVRISDISDRKQAEFALRDSEQRFSSLAKAAPVGIFRFDAFGNCVYVNDRWSDLTGRPVAAGLGQGWIETIHPDDRERVKAAWIRWLQDSEPEKFFQSEARILRVDGSLIWYYCQAIAESDARGDLSGYVGIIADISDRKSAEEQLYHINEQLALANADLARATRLKDEFLANMSHELRTPLNAILGMSEALQEGIFGDINERQTDAIALVERSGKHLLELINDILDLSKIESGKLELNVSPVSIQSLCDSSLIFVRQMAYKRNIQLNSCIPPDIGNIEADERRLRQVLINLLNNAIKFTTDGGCVTLDVSRHTADQDEHEPIGQSWVLFAVIDTGIGIAPENFNKLFQPFVQIDSSLNRQYSGTGLGLSLVHRIAELHGGDVTVRSELGQGSCFTVRIPDQSYLDLKPEEPDSSQSNDNLLLLGKDAVEPNDRAAPLVLLAEDNTANVETMSAYIQSQNYRLILAADGQEAIDLAHSQYPDLILMDIQMPGVDGLEAIRQLRQEPEFADTPIIALTALAMTGDRERCLAAGATEYMTKPVSLKQMMQVMRQLLA